MVRKQIYIEARHEAMLKQQAKAAGVSEAELIRRWLDGGAGRVSAFPDAKSWASERSFIQQRRGLKAPQTGRGWTREGLYEERFGRLPH